MVRLCFQFVPVKVLTATKRPTASSNHSKSSSSSSKRSQNGDNQSSITHTGLPVNPFTAKALASKLNERNQFLNGAKNQAAKSAPIPSRPAATVHAKSASSVKDVPVPPLISIQARSAGTENGQQHSTAGPALLTTNSTEDYELFGTVPAFNIFKSNSTVTNDSSTHGNDSMVDETKMVRVRLSLFALIGQSNDHFFFRVFRQPAESTQRSGKCHRCDLCGKKFSKVSVNNRSTGKFTIQNILNNHCEWLSSSQTEIRIETAHGQS